MSCYSRGQRRKTKTKTSLHITIAMGAFYFEHSVFISNDRIFQSLILNTTQIFCIKCYSTAVELPMICIKEIEYERKEIKLITEIHSCKFIKILRKINLTVLVLIFAILERIQYSILRLLSECVYQRTGGQFTDELHLPRVCVLAALHARVQLPVRRSFSTFVNHRGYWDKRFLSAGMNHVGRSVSFVP